MIKTLICLFRGHNILESKCPYTQKTYQECIRCRAIGVKAE